MIVSGEASGDIHGANLINAMLEQDPHIVFSGMGGKQLTEAGVNILFEAQKVSVVGIVEILSHLPDILSAQRILRSFLKKKKPSLLIIIDFPDFNLMLASVAKKLGIPVFYYITPQVWAWRSGRVKKIQKLTDELGVILPFEEPFFKERGVSAKYVGHPLLDSVKPAYGRETFFKNESLSETTILVGLIPGSRDREVLSLFPIFLDAARKLYRPTDKNVVFMVPQASTISKEQLDTAGLQSFIDDGYQVKLIKKEHHEAMSACDVVVAASGTVTLELALLDVPMVVVYKTSPITYFFGKLLVKIEHFSLVNLIADNPFIVELLQDDVTPENISNELSSILNDTKRNSTIREGLAAVREKLGSPGASKRAADLALGIINSNG